MCHDERFLNLWIKDCPFTLDYITDLPCYVDQDHYQTTFDDKSGYEHIQLHPPSSTYFGLEWGGWYFSYATLPFGWKGCSAYIYRTVGMVATHYIRSNGVPCSQYIDDRHTGQLRLPRACTNQLSNFQLAQMAAFVACSLLISLGYFISLKKSILTPCTYTSVRFLGYLSDSEKQAFIPPGDKRINFASPRESILEKKCLN